MRPARIIGGGEPPRQERRAQRRTKKVRRRAAAQRQEQGPPVLRRVAAPQRGQTAPKYKPGDMPKPGRGSSDDVPEIMKDDWGDITGLYANLQLLEAEPMPFEKMEPKSSDPIPTGRDNLRPTENDLIKKAPEYDIEKPETWPREHERERVKQTSVVGPAVPPASRQVAAAAQAAPVSADDMRRRVETGHKIARLQSELGIVPDERIWDQAYKLAEEGSHQELEDKYAEMTTTVTAARKQAAMQAPVEETSHFMPPRVAGLGGLASYDEQERAQLPTAETLFGG